MRTVAKQEFSSAREKQGHEFSSSPMRAVVASNTGIVKVFDTKQHKVVQQWGKATKDDEVTKMIWADTEQTKVKQLTLLYLQLGTNWSQNRLHLHSFH